MGGIFIIKVVLFFCFGHQGASLFSNWNAELAIWGIKRGHIEMKLGKIGPWPLMEVTCGLFGFLATRGPSLFTNQNAKVAVLGILRSHIGMKLGRIIPWLKMEVPFCPLGFRPPMG